MRIDDVVAETQEAMAEASAVVLDGFRLRSDVKIVRWPDRYMDERGREFWGRVMALLPAESDGSGSSDREPSRVSRSGSASASWEWRSLAWRGPGDTSTEGIGGLAGPRTTLDRSRAATHFQ